MESSLQEKTVVVYAGDRSETGQYHGYGRAVFNSGQVYDGEWQAGHMHGRGRISFPDGVNYEGAFCTDQITGSGVYQWGNIVYEGEVQQGLRHGAGMLTYTDSLVVYEGQWQNGKRHGRGALYYDANRSAYYEGDWQDDIKHGQGTSMYPSGNSYTGSWFQDKRQGHGTMNWVTKGQVYNGEWSDDLPNGLGEHVWQQGLPSLQMTNHAMNFMYNRYFGMFKDGKRHGEGSLWYSNGARYEGQRELDKKQGPGVYVFEDGSVFSGQFAADRPVLDAGTFSGAADTFPPEIHTAGATDRPRGSSTATPRDTALAATGAQAVNADGSATSTSAASATCPPGFGLRVSALQLYIDDLLQDVDKPAATYKAISNLLVGHNSELRALYDRYCNRLSPFLPPDAPRNSWALQAGQLWELLKDSQLLSRHLQLKQASEILQKSLEPPPAVLEHRQQALSGTDAAAVLSQPRYPFDPTTELLYRDFCELMVRLAAVRYPQLTTLERQLQQVIIQHLLPLLGPGAGRPGGFRTSSAGIARMSQASSATVASSGAVSQAAASAVGMYAPAVAAAVGASGADSEQLQNVDVVLYLQTQALALQQLYVAFVADGLDHSAAAQAGVAEQVAAATANQVPVRADTTLDSKAWWDTPVTVRQVLSVLQLTGVLQHWQLAADDVAALLLESLMSVADPEGPRAHMDEANLEPADIDQQPTTADQASAAAAAYQELAYWMDAQLLLPELIWGLVRCAAVLTDQQVSTQLTQAAAAAQQQVAQHADGNCDLLTKVQVWLEGNNGLLDLVLGLGPNHEEAEDSHQDRPEQQKVELDNADDPADSALPDEAADHDAEAADPDDVHR